MKKQELIHLHGLFDAVRHNYEDRTGNSVESDQYFELGVMPNSIHKSKTDHKAAIFSLLDGITSEIQEPGSTYAGLRSLEKPVMEEAAVQYENKNQDTILVNQGLVPLSEKQTDHLVENTQIEYVESTYGSDRLKVPHSKVEIWAEETCRELG